MDILRSTDLQLCDYIHTTDTSPRNIGGSHVRGIPILPTSSVLNVGSFLPTNRSIIWSINHSSTGYWFPTTTHSVRHSLVHFLPPSLLHPRIYSLLDYLIDGLTGQVTCWLIDRPTHKLVDYVADKPTDRPLIKSFRSGPYHLLSFGTSPTPRFPSFVLFFYETFPTGFLT